MLIQIWINWKKREIDLYNYYIEEQIERHKNMKIISKSISLDSYNLS